MFFIKKLLTYFYYIVYYIYKTNEFIGGNKMNIIKTDTKKLMMTIVNAIDEWAEDDFESE